MKRIGLTILITAIFLPLAGCWKENMGSQPKVLPMQQSEFFADGTAARPLPLGVIPRGDLRVDSLLYSGFLNGKPSDVFPAHYPAESDGPFPTRGQPLRRILLRGQEQFAISCIMCHGDAGDGRGIIVQRGMVPPPSFHLDRLRQAPVGHFFDVITNGYGQMYGYGERISPSDRWAIVAYVRLLQMTQAMPIASVREMPAP